jgi:hypothetical protein
MHIEWHILSLRIMLKDEGNVEHTILYHYKNFIVLTLKISSDQIWVARYFGQPLTYP